jgi:nitroreductase
MSVNDYSRGISKKVMIVVSDILKLLMQRQSGRVPFDPHRPVSKEDLRQILEAGKWAPTAHNMQNFEILVVDDKETLDRVGDVRSRISAEFLRENYEQLSFSEEELLRKKVGIMGTMFPPSWRDLNKLEEAARQNSPRALNQTINGSPMLLIVMYDSRKRAPASEGDVLGFMSLGCVMENMWLMAQSLGISLQILSVFSAGPVAKEVKRILNIPEYMNIAYTCRLGYPSSKPAKYLRVRRDIEDFTHHDNYQNKGALDFHGRSRTSLEE